MANASLNVQGETPGWDGSDVSACWAALARRGARTTEPPGGAPDGSARGSGETGPVCWLGGRSEMVGVGVGARWGLLGWGEMKREEKRKAKRGRPPGLSRSILSLTCSESCRVKFLASASIGPPPLWRKLVLETQPLRPRPDPCTHLPPCNVTRNVFSTLQEHKPYFSVSKHGRGGSLLPMLASRILQDASPAWSPRPLGQTVVCCAAGPVVPWPAAQPPGCSTYLHTACLSEAASAAETPGTVDSSSGHRASMPPLGPDPMWQHNCQGLREPSQPQGCV